MEIALNPAFREMFRQPARYYYNRGGRWSAKTYDSIQIIIYRLLFVPHSRAAFMRKVYASIRDTLFHDTLEILVSLGVKYSATLSPLYIRLSGGSDIIFKGADDPEKLKGLSSVDIVLMDEANEFSAPDFETIDQSIRGKHQENSIYLCHNPVPKLPSELFWFEKIFHTPDVPGVFELYYDKDLGSDVCCMLTTYHENLKCPEHTKRRLEGYKLTNPALYSLWALGEYAEVEGAVFKNWDIIDELPKGLDDPGYGLDFGYSIDPAALVRVWHNSEELWIEGLVYSVGLTNVELFTIMKSKGVGDYDQIIADSAEPKSIRDLHDRGLKRISGVKKRSGYKEDMANVLQGYKIHLLAGDISLVREFQTYSWAKGRDGRQLPKLQDGNDHYMDAFIMFCTDKLRKKKEISFYRR